jgi:nucleoside-diphosphate-sugar epimerase
LQKLEDKYRLKETDINLADCSTPDMTYGWAKLTGEFCLQYLEQAGIKVNVFRPFSGYGTDQDLDYPFPSYIRRGNLKLDPFEIWGDGQQVRDFIHMPSRLQTRSKTHFDCTSRCDVSLLRPIKDVIFLQT